MTKTHFGCGHPRTEDNQYLSGKQIICRQCKLIAKRRWRERVRERQLAAMRGRPKFTPIQLPPELQPRPAEPLTPEAIGSRQLLEAYARYYERHVKSEAA